MNTNFEGGPPIQNYPGESFINETGIFSQGDWNIRFRMYNLLGTNFYLYNDDFYINVSMIERKPIYVWYYKGSNDNYYKIVTFEYVLDNSPEDIQTKLLFHLDLFIVKK
jgi:hypothetical protein